jgi:hypothetical protein
LPKPELVIMTSLFKHRIVTPLQLVALAALTVMGVLLNPGGRDVAAQAQSAAGYVCFPTCSQVDGRFLALLKTSGAAMTPPSIQIELTAPPRSSEVSFEVFDANSTGLWDQVGALDLQFALYADPAGDGSGVTGTVLQTWSVNSLAACSASPNNTPYDNCWAGASVANNANALAPSGAYRYVLVASSTSGVNTAGNGFKLRTTGTVGLNLQTFSYVGNVFGTGAIPIVNTANLNNANYDGSWSFSFQLEPGATAVSIWDGDLDFGSPVVANACVDSDSNDSDTPGAFAGLQALLNSQFVPVLAQTMYSALTFGSALRPEGFAWLTQASPSTTSANCSSGGEADMLATLQRPVLSTFLRNLNGRGVAFELVDPNGVRYPNIDPSGNLEWEQFLVSLASAFPHPELIPTLLPGQTYRLPETGSPEHLANRAFGDYAAGSLPTGVYTIRVEGVDLANFNSFVVGHAVLGRTPNDVPAPADAFYTLNGLVFDDANRDGDLDGGEAGIPHVQVEILKNEQNGQTVQASFVSNTTVSTGTPIGSYSVRVPAGNYTVRVTTLANSGVLTGRFATTVTESAPIMFGESDEFYGSANFGYATQGLLTVDVADVTRVYGTSNPAFTPIYSLPESVTGVVGATCSTTATESTPVGTVAITCAGPASVPNYDIVYGGGFITITPAPSTVTVGQVEVTYDGQPHTTMALVSGVGDGINQNVTWTYSGSCAGAPPTTVAQGAACTATAHYAGDANHLPGEGSNTIKILPLPITVTADAKSKAYGTGDPALTYQVTTGGLLGDDSLSGSLSRVAGETVAGGPYAIQQGSLTAGGNYTLTYVGANLTIDKIALTIAADNQTRAYGDANPTLTGSVSSNSDGITGTFSTAANATTPVGVHTGIILGTLVDPNGKLGNYNVTNTPGTLTVTKAPISILIPPVEVPYDGTPKGSSCQVSGANGFTATGVVTYTGVNPTVYAASTVKPTAAGTYAMTCEYEDPTYGPGTGGPSELKITKIAATVKAKDVVKTYGATVTFNGTAVEYTQGGFLGSDGVTAASLGSAGSPAGANVGGYDITIGGGTGNGLANYTVTYLKGTLTVEKATPVATATGGTFVVSSTPRPGTCTVTGIGGAVLTGTSTYTPGGSTAPTAVGSYTLTCSFPGDTNYKPASTTANITITSSNLPPTCSAATGGEIWPPNHKKFYAAPINGVRDPEGRPVTITITAILQDELLDSTGDGNFTPDGQGVGTSTAWVRAERNGHQNNAPGNGRVYEIQFSATDGVNQCTGSVLYGVPHDQGQRATAIDSGVRYDSTVYIPGTVDKKQTHKEGK